MNDGFFTALIVDDDRKSLERMHATLEAEGFAVLTATSDAEGRREVFAGHPDVIFVALRSRRIDGMAFARGLRRAGVDWIPILLLAAESEMDFLPWDGMEETNIERVLFKPIAPGALRSCMRDLLDHHRSLRGAGAHNVGGGPQEPEHR